MGSFINELQRVLREQRRARDEVFASGDRRRGGPLQGLEDWVMEEVLMLSDEERRFIRVKVNGEDELLPYLGETKMITAEEWRELNFDSTAGTKIRTFDTGATRDADEDKPDPEGFLSPLVIQRFNAYMHTHRRQSNGALRASDNWQRGMPREAYIKSGWRHFLDWWSEHRGYGSREGLEDALCALLFNVSGYLHEVLKEKIKNAKDTRNLDKEK